MCICNKYLIECYEDKKYQCTINAVFETKNLAENYLKLYLEGRKNCTFVIRAADYYFN